jgi:hypothetical protein
VAARAAFGSRLAAAIDAPLNVTRLLAFDEATEGCRAGSLSLESPERRIAHRKRQHDEPGASTSRSGVTGWQLRDIRRTFRSTLARLKVPPENGLGRIHLQYSTFGDMGRVIRSRSVFCHVFSDATEDRSHSFEERGRNAPHNKFGAMPH